MVSKFNSDKAKCSFFPEGNWHRCCVKHDESYYYGGTWAKRMKVDRKLYYCVKSKGHPFIALFMYYGVRFSGWPFWSRVYSGPKRWGHGLNAPSTYEEE